MRKGFFFFWENEDILFPLRPEKRLLPVLNTANEQSVQYTEHKQTFGRISRRYFGLPCGVRGCAVVCCGEVIGKKLVGLTKQQFFTVMT